MRRLGSRRFLRRGRYFYFDVVTGLAAQLVSVSSRVKASAHERIFDEIGGGIELCIMPHVALADFAGQLLHIGAELFAQRDFIRRKRRCV